ncbi:hypothetical protein QL285_052974 [Trifolium repens]|jgi:hypothetical protein|nr:hypothetical protein QL285_052974 [Trifolium repens]
MLSRCATQESFDILLAELYVIYKSILLAQDMDIDELICYSDSLYYCVNFIKCLQVRYRIHAVLIQDIKELLSHTDLSLYHTLKEENQYTDLFAKLGAFSDVNFLTHVSSPEAVRDFLKNDAMITFFLHE